MPKRRLIVHPVGGIGHHQARGGPGEEPGDIRRRCRVPAREAVAAELEHVAAPDRGRGGRGQHGVLVGLRLRKEQAIHERIFQNLEAVRAAVGTFVEQYDTTWRLEKLGYQTPIEARQEHELRQAA